MSDINKISVKITGDESGLSLWRGVAMLAFLGLAVVVVLLFILRRKEKQKN